MVSSDQGEPPSNAAEHSVAGPQAVSTARATAAWRPSASRSASRIASAARGSSIEGIGSITRTRVAASAGIARETIVAPSGNGGRSRAILRARAERAVGRRDFPLRFRAVEIAHQDDRLVGAVVALCVERAQRFQIHPRDRRFRSEHRHRAGIAAPELPRRERLELVSRIGAILGQLFENDSLFLLEHFRAGAWSAGSCRPAGEALLSSSRKEEEAGTRCARAASRRCCTRPGNPFARRSARECATRFR